MSRPHTAVGRRSGQGGFTLPELLVYTVIAGLVMGSVYQLLLSQSLSYSKQRELLDVHESLRGGAALLAWELRQASAAGGDLYAIGANSVALRSVQATGTVCARHPTLARFGLWELAGEFDATVDDTAMVFVAGAPGTSDDGWKVMKIQQVDAPASLGVAACVWAGAPAADTGVALVVGAATDTAGLAVGAPLRAFRRVEYGLYADGGRWWLGRKVGAAGSYQKLTGPLLASGGLVLNYFDAAGNPTADPTQVAVVELVLRGESLKKARSGSGAPQFQQDSVATRIALRG